MSNEPDPTKDPKFKQVVDYFLKTPPKPHKRKSDEKDDKRRTRERQDNDQGDDNE